MRVAINGTGVAGPTLAYWLQRWGHEPVLFEQAPALRTGGYVIDFWGLGYDIAEWMGVLPELRAKAYIMQELRVVDEAGSPVAGMDMAAFRASVGERFFSIPRGEIAATLFDACKGVDARFGVSVIGVENQADGVTVELSDGSRERYDLLVGADGLHSHTRSLAFGPEARFERSMGCYVATFRIQGYQPRDELTYVMHTAPRRQLGRFALRGDVTIVLLIFRADLLDSDPSDPLDTSDLPGIRATLRTVFGEMGWEAPRILERMDGVEEIYFDRVSQIDMEHWSQGRVALVGDAAACVSLLGGEGTGLAMIEAYVLAGELSRTPGDLQAALLAYERRLRPFLVAKQRTAKRFVGFFAPADRLGWRVRDWCINSMNRPFIARHFLGRALRDDLTLPTYGK